MKKAEITKLYEIIGPLIKALDNLEYSRALEIAPASVMVDADGFRTDAGLLLAHVCVDYSTDVPGIKVDDLRRLREYAYGLVSEETVDRTIKMLNEIKQRKEAARELGAKREAA